MARGIDHAMRVWDDLPYFLKAVIVAIVVVLVLVLIGKMESASNGE